jgi:hypothetical protein
MLLFFKAVKKRKFPMSASYRKEVKSSLGLSVFGHRGGYIMLLMMVVAMAIGAVVYFVAVYPEQWQLKKSQTKHPDKFPWVEEWRIKHLGLEKPKGHEELGLSDEHPEITTLLRFIAHLKKGEESFCNVSFVILPGGNVSGGLGGDFDTVSPHKNHVLNCSFEGNTDPSKVFHDDYGDDRSKLFFIAVGNFRDLVTDFETNKVGLKSGVVYLVGWLTPDMKATGRLHMTSDKRSQEIYTWEAQGKESEGFFPLLDILSGLKQ